MTTPRDGQFVLLTTDFSEFAERAIPHAARMARALGLPVRVIHVIETFTKHEGERFVPRSKWEWRVTDMVETRLAEVVKTLNALGVAAETVYRAGAPWREILHELDSGAVVGAISTHGYGAVARFLLGTCAYKVIRESTVPLLIVGRDTPDGDYARCLIPTPLADAEPPFMEALKWPKLLGAEVEVIHAVDPGYGSAGLLWGEEALGQMLRDRVRVAWEHMDRLTALAAESGVTASAYVAELARPGEAIAERAEETKAGLIVMPAHRYSRMERFFLGSVTEGVIRRATVPVLMFRPPGE